MEASSVGVRGSLHPDGLTHPGDMMRDVDERSRPEVWKLLMKSCATSAGVFTTSEARSLGYDLRRLPRLVSNGTVVRESRGVYRLAAYPFGLEQRLLVAKRTTDGVVSHETAALLWGFDGFDESTTIHVTVRHGYLLLSPRDASRSTSPVAHWRD